MENVSAEDILNEEIDQTIAEEISVDFRHKLAQQTVKNWAQWATVAGFIPVPLLDTAAISGVQIKMIHDLCNVYQVEFKKELVISIVGALVGGGVATVFSSSIGSMVARQIPVVGGVLSAVTQPALSYASTYAVGSTFVKHFEKNGSLIDFNVEEAKGFFKERYEKAKQFFRKNKSDSVEITDVVVEQQPT